MEKVVIPERQEFTPSQAGRAIGKDRQHIYSYMKAGKLAWFIDYEGRRRITRKDLIDFATRFLGMNIDQVSA